MPLITVGRGGGGQFDLTRLSAFFGVWGGFPSYLCLLHFLAQHLMYTGL